MPTDDGIYRGVRDGKIALWQAENSYGTERDVPGIRNFTIATNPSTDSLKGDDHTIDRYYRIDSAIVTWENAVVGFEVAQMFLGGDLVSNGDYIDHVVGEEDAPYVAIAGKQVASDGSEMHLFVPKARPNGPITMTAQIDNYAIQSAQFEGVYEGPINQIFRRRKFFVPTALEIPLRTTPGGL